MVSLIGALWPAERGQQKEPREKGLKQLELCQDER